MKNIIFKIFKKPEEKPEAPKVEEPEIKPVRKSKKGPMHVEIFLLFKFFTPIQIVKEFGYSPATVYRYWKRYNEARKKIIEMLKEKIPNIEQQI